MMKAQYLLENELLLGAERVIYFLSILDALFPPPAKIIKCGECGINLTYTLDENGILTIISHDIQFYLPGFAPEPKPMWNFEYDERKNLDSPWWNERGMISHIEIKDGVSSIGDYAFKECEGLKSLIIPESVTSIGNHAFEDCTGLTKIDIPPSVVSIGKCAFEYCVALKSLIIPESVTSIGSDAFSDCTALSSVTIPDSLTRTGIYISIVGRTEEEEEEYQYFP